MVECSSQWLSADNDCRSLAVMLYIDRHGHGHAGSVYSTLATHPGALPAATSGSVLGGRAGGLIVGSGNDGPRGVHYAAANTLITHSLADTLTDGVCVWRDIAIIRSLLAAVMFYR